MSGSFEQTRRAARRWFPSPSPPARRAAQSSPPNSRRRATTWRCCAPEYRRKRPAGLRRRVQRGVRRVEELASADRPRLAAWALGCGGVAEGVLQDGAWATGIGFTFWMRRLRWRAVCAAATAAFLLECDGRARGRELLWRTSRRTYAAVILRRDRSRWTSCRSPMRRSSKACSRTCTPKRRAGSGQPRLFAASAAHSPAPSVAQPRGAHPGLPRHQLRIRHRPRRSSAPAPSRRSWSCSNLTAAATSRRASTRSPSAIAGRQIIVLPGGFSGGDEPDGSGKFITAFFRNAAVQPTRSHELLEDARRPDAGHLQRLPGADQAGARALRRDRATSTTDCPTLTFNAIGRHQSHAGAHPRGLQQVPLADALRSVGDVHTVADFPRRGPLRRQREACWRSWPKTGRSPRSTSILTAHPTDGHALQPQRLRLTPSRASPPPMGACYGKMGALRAHGRRPVTKTSPATNSRISSAARWITSACKQDFFAFRPETACGLRTFFSIECRAMLCYTENIKNETRIVIAESEESDPCCATKSKFATPTSSC